MITKLVQVQEMSVVYFRSLRGTHRIG